MYLKYFIYLHYMTNAVEKYISETIIIMCGGKDEKNIYI